MSNIIRSKYKSDYIVIDWTMRIKTSLMHCKWKRQCFLLLMLLIVLVATFNIISSLFMVVSEKKSDIAILKTLECIQEA